jgi:hypothetical protein
MSQHKKIAAGNADAMTKQPAENAKEEGFVSGMGHDESMDGFKRKGFVSGHDFS